MDESFYNWVENPDCEEGIFWDSWLKDHPDKMADANQAKKLLKALSFKDKAFDKAEITDLWEKIKSESVDTSKTVRFRPWKYLKVAAVIAPFILAAVLFLFFREIPNEDQVVEQLIIEKNNPKGEKRTVYLSDGSKVKLNAESTIKYLKPFSENQRVVELEGEAFFEVTPEKSRPFIVKSGNIETRVLGTSFNIKAYSKDNNIKVAVKSGKVTVENKSKDFANKQNRSVVLSPSEMAIYSEESNNTIVSSFDPKEVFGWNEGTLYFNNASMGEFVEKLERWYGIDIIVKREMPIKKGIVGEFHNQTLEEILIGTRDVSEFDYEFKGGKLIIK